MSKQTERKARLDHVLRIWEYHSLVFSAGDALPSASQPMLWVFRVHNTSGIGHYPICDLDIEAWIDSSEVDEAPDDAALLALVCNQIADSFDRDYPGMRKI